MKHTIVICANIFIKKDEKYFLLKRSQDKKFAPWFVHPFGWKVEHNENPYEAAVREIQEEVGIEVSNLKLEAVITELQPNKAHDENRTIYHFSAEYLSWDIKSTDPYDGEWIWLTPEEIKKQQLFPSVTAIIDDILNESKGTVFTTMSYAWEESGAMLEKKHVCR